MKTNLSSDGFSLTGTVTLIAVLVAIGAAGVYVWHSKQDTKPVSTAVTPTVTPVTDQYAGWKSFCDTENEKGCYKYPSDWTAGQYGELENPTKTAYVDFRGYNNKDQAGENALIVQIEDLNNTQLGIKIVGYVANNAPIYTIYNTSVTSSLKVGQSALLATTNPQFSRNQGANMSFTASPELEAFTAFTNIDQAKQWFTTPEAQTCLKVLQSFHYQGENDEK